MSQWENEEEELEEPLPDPQEEVDHQEEEDRALQEGRQHNPLQQQPMSKPWAKILPSSMEIGVKRTPS